ncbi:hypothetical protein ITX31_07990 [Arthrobacter gandavensis]|uniref:hypothetical protein n=1 Tax=Arthrobacter gandavensis TaxID=169960 RepID=UPI00188E0BDB|nr:hypothetical protein [Arthrobacter gandavensis]MBF4994049.1 hypothetical protein [Arthrobacter gandavensis]
MIRVLLLVLTAFSAFWTVMGFVYLGPGGAAGWSTEYLVGSMFTSYFWPAVILLLAVGGPQAVAFVQLLRRSGSGLFWTAAAGFSMTIWIIAEQMLFRVPDYGGEWIVLPVLQAVFAGIGLAELGCALVLLGLFRPGVVRAALGARANMTNHP